MIDLTIPALSWLQMQYEELFKENPTSSVAHATEVMLKNVDVYMKEIIFRNVG